MNPWRSPNGNGAATSAARRVPAAASKFAIASSSTASCPKSSAPITKNIGVGGAFIITPDPSPPGTSLQIALQVPATSRAIEVRGEVRWIVDGKHDEPEAEHGMGVKFAGLDVEQLMALNEYFASLTSTMDHDEA